MHGVVLVGLTVVQALLPSTPFFRQSANCIHFGTPNDWGGMGIDVRIELSPGGVHIVMGDAAVKFINDAVDTATSMQGHRDSTTQTALPRSPFGAWGALGTKNGAKRSL